MDVHIRFVIKHIQRAGHIQVECLRYPVRFRQVLVEQGLVQIGEDGHILRAGIRQIGAVDGFHGWFSLGLSSLKSVCHTRRSLYISGHSKTSSCSSIILHGEAFCLLSTFYGPVQIIFQTGLLYLFDFLFLINTS